MRDIPTFTNVLSLFECYNFDDINQKSFFSFYSNPPILNYKYMVLDHLFNIEQVFIEIFPNAI